MVTGDFVSEIALDDGSAEISTILQKENVVDLEIPVRGLLLKESVIVCDNSHGHVEAQSSNISHFCTGTFNYPLFIRTVQNNHTLMCRLSDLLVYSGKLVLSDFQLLDQTWIDRQWERVQPRLPIFVTIIKNRKKIRANLFDLSQTGMCILIDKSVLGDPNKLMNKEFRIQMNLPPGNTACNVKGRVIQKRYISDNLLRLGLEISMLKKDGMIISQYLSKRKRDILDELFLNFKELLHYRDVKDLYF